MLASQLSQQRGLLREAGLLPSQRTRLPTALGGARCSRAGAQRRRRAGGVLAAAGGLRNGQENQSPQPPAPRPPTPPSWLERAVSRAALLLPLAALSLGFLGLRSAAWAKPPVQGPAPVAQRTDASELIDESTGTAQQWLYSRGPWNQRQYGTIHKFYTDRQATEAEQQASLGAAAAGAVAAQQAAAAEQQAAVPPATVSAGVSQQPARTVAAPGAVAAPAAGIPSSVADAVAQLNQLGARVSDAVSGVSLGSVNLNGVDMNDPQVQRSAAVVGATIIALLLFWGRQAQHSQQQQQEDGSAGAGGEAGSSADASYDAGDSGAGGKPAAAAAATAAAAVATAVGTSDTLSREELQAVAQRRIEAAKQQVAEEQRRLAEAGAAGAAGAAGLSEAKQARQEAAEAVVMTDMEMIADGGSVGKFTTDAAAALAIAEEAQAAAAAEAAATEAAAVEASAAVAAAAAQAEAAAAAAAEAEQQREAAARLEAAAAEERRQQEEAAAARAQAAAEAEQQRAKAASLEAAAAEERQQQEAEAAARAAQQAVVEATAVLVATAAEERPVIGSSFGLDPATVGTKSGTEPQPAAAAAAAPTSAATGQPVAATAPAAVTASPAVVGGAAAGSVPPNVAEARAWIAAWKGKAARADVAPEQAPSMGKAAPAGVVREQAPSTVPAGSSSNPVSGFFAAAANMFRGFGSGGKAAAANNGAAAAVSPALTGAMLTTGSAPGGGRTMEAATERAVAAAMVAVAANAQLDAAAMSAAARVAASQQQQQQVAPAAPVAPAPAAAAQKKQWDPISLLLAPAAPLLAALPSISGSAEGSKGGNKYDMLLSMLSAAAAAPAVQEDSRYDPVRDLLAVVPSSGVPRYDFARSLLRGMVAEQSGSDDGAFDMAHGLLQRVRSGDIVPTGGSSYDPVWALLKEAALLEEWGVLTDSKYDPWAGLTDWVGPAPVGTVSRYDPWKDLVNAAWEGRQAAEAAKYSRDPLRQFIRDFAAPKGASRYDPAVGLFALAGSDWRGPTGRSKYCMVAAALDAAAGWEVPTGDSRYCPMSEFLNAAEGWEAPTGRGSFDPLAWLLNGWAGSWRQPAGSHSKYDPAASLLAAQPAPSSQREKFDPLSDLVTGDFSIAPPEAPPTSRLFSQFTGGAHGQQAGGEAGMAQAVPSRMSDWN